MWGDKADQDRGGQFPGYRHPAPPGLHHHSAQRSEYARLLHGLTWEDPQFFEPEERAPPRPTVQLGWPGYARDSEQHAARRVSQG